MASKRTSDPDPYDGQMEGEYPSDLATDVAEVAIIALEAEAETDRMRQQQDQIEKLFRLVSKQRGLGPGQNGNPPKDTPAVQRFRARMKVLKLAYPNTRI